MQNIQNIEATYISSSGKIFKGYIFLNDGMLIFYDLEKIILKIHKDEITSFKIKNFIFNKNISIRTSESDYKFKVKKNSVNSIVNFIKSTNIE